jgi:hypothetical protein
VTNSEQALLQTVASGAHQHDLLMWFCVHVSVCVSAYVSMYDLVRQ